MWHLAQILAIVGFVLAIGLELAWGAHRGAIGYSWRTSVVNALIGVGSLGFGAITVLQGFAVHRWLDRHALVTLPRDRVLTWVAVVIATDLAFYWSHRAMHRVNLLWTAHAVHHHSEEFNLLAALRIGWTSVYVSWIFYLPLALVGMTLPMTLAARAASSLYQFPQHTRWIGRLGWLEHVVVTPSHHRVHHGKDAGYVDRNFGGIFICWDQLFGTFAREDREPAYGVTPSAATLGPIAAQLVEWRRLFGLWQRTGWRARWRVALAAPEWEPRGG